MVSSVNNEVTPDASTGPLAAQRSVPQASMSMALPQSHLDAVSVAMAMSMFMQPQAAAGAASAPPSHSNSSVSQPSSESPVSLIYNVPG